MIGGLLAVALVWGGTNPLLKRGAHGIDAVSSERWPRVVAQFLFLACRWQYVLPFVINMCGSLLFYKLLGEYDLTIVSPICNALTFVVTTLVSLLLGERIGNRRTLVGMALVVLGSAICLHSAHAP